MKHATSYQSCSPPDDSPYWNSLAIAVAEVIDDNDTEDDVRICAIEIAYKVNRENGIRGFRFATCADDVRDVAGNAVYYKAHDSLP